MGHTTREWGGGGGEGGRGRGGGGGGGGEGINFCQEGEKEGATSLRCPIGGYFICLCSLSSTHTFSRDSTHRCVWKTFKKISSDPTHFYCCCRKQALSLRQRCGPLFWANGSSCPVPAVAAVVVLLLGQLARLHCRLPPPPSHPSG